MTILDNRLSEYVLTLHEIARVVEQKIGDAALSDTLRKSADKLSDLAQSKVSAE